MGKGKNSNRIISQTHRAFKIEINLSKDSQIDDESEKEIKKILKSYLNEIEWIMNVIMTHPNIFWEFFSERQNLIKRYSKIYDEQLKEEIRRELGATNDEKGEKETNKKEQIEWN